MELKKSNRGGKRIGAGRKPIDGATKVPTQIRLDADLNFVFKSDKSINRNRYINNSVRNAMLEDGLLPSKND